MWYSPFSPCWGRWQKPSKRVQLCPFLLTKLSDIPGLPEGSTVGSRPACSIPVLEAARLRPSCVEDNILCSEGPRRDPSLPPPGFWWLLAILGLWVRRLWVCLCARASLSATCLRGSSSCEDPSPYVQPAPAWPPFTWLLPSKILVPNKVFS